MQLGEASRPEIFSTNYPRADTSAAQKLRQRFTGSENGDLKNALGGDEARPRGHAADAG
jgi:hypothetical protein